MDIPVLNVVGKTLPEAYERAILAVLDHGCRVRTEYDKGGDPLSADATVGVLVRDPLGEPRMHKNFPGGPVELQYYIEEVVLGIHDHWIDPEAGKWTYTYHQRLCEFLADPGAPGITVAVNQVAYIVDKLAQAPHSRRAQAVTWNPHFDPQTDDPPCMQRVWCRLTPGRDEHVLNMNVYWRSRDLWKAFFMNAYAFIELMRVIATSLEIKMGVPVRVGRYFDMSDSLHIYGCDIDAAMQERYKMLGTSWRERAWRSDEPAVASMMAEAHEKLAADPDYFAKGGKLG